ncbi:DUF397 domain-containing protein [Sphaerisporangium aureirubrum]|uniref:DUF397 domain-containing protein n=1 Tax=Sphaerisporangium aureirubrum TaxID=1544736 RepID=A0ABW1NMK8_9ACTN
MDQPSVRWRRSTRSATTGGECVEVAVVRGVGPAGGPVYMVRDSKRSRGPVLTVTWGGWAAFVRGVKTGRITG